MSVILANRDERKPLQVCAKLGHLVATKTSVEGDTTLNDTVKDGFTPVIVAA